MLANRESNAEVRSQLAASIRRLDVKDGLPVWQKLITHTEDLDDKHIPLLLWWSLEEMVSKDADTVLEFLEDQPQLWEAPIFKEHLAGRLARRLSWERGNHPSFSRKNPEENWMAFAKHPRSRMPEGKGDYSEWHTNYTPEISTINLNRLAKLFRMAPSLTYKQSLLNGMATGLAQGPPVKKIPVSLQKTFKKLQEELPDTTLAKVASQVGSSVDLPWDGQVLGGATETEQLQQRLDEGRLTYETHCASCHQTDGSGMERMAAPLQGSKFVKGEEERLIRLVLHGLRGELQMPPMKALADVELANILTYVRSRWGEGAGPVAPKTIDSIRAETSDRDHSWNREELLNLEVGINDK